MYETYECFCPRAATCRHNFDCQKGPAIFFSSIKDITAAKWNRWCKEAEKIRDDGRTAEEVLEEYKRTKYIPKIKKEELSPEDASLYMYLEPFFKRQRFWGHLLNPHGYITISPKHKPFLMAPIYVDEEKEYNILFYTLPYLRKFVRYIDDMEGNHYDWEQVLDILFYPIRDALAKKGLKIHCPVN